MIIHVDKAYVYVSLKEDVFSRKTITSYQKKETQITFHLQMS